MEGIITKTSRTGGIQIDNNEKWINPSRNTMPNIYKMGDKVRIELNNNGEYINVIGTKTNNTNVQIIRQSAIKSAVELMNTTLPLLEEEAQNELIKDIPARVLEVAERFEEWVLR